MRRKSLLALALLLVPLAMTQAAGRWTLAGWNNLGMHCMDADFSVFSILPPYNTIQAQLTDPNGRLVKDPSTAGITVTYEAVADATGSSNTTSAGKTNFWQYVQKLFGVNPPVDTGLKSNAMPGTSNRPRTMTWDGTKNWWIAEGIPITPKDDAGRKNTYPMFKLVARDAQGTVLASTSIVLPVSDEMDCRVCHGSSSNNAAARPNRGWVNNADPQVDQRLNILLRHDDRFAADATFQAAARAVGYNVAGLYPTATAGQPVLCAACHASEALAAGGQPGVEALTRAMHALHAGVLDPTTNQTLQSATNRTACYRCHPGAATKCLRGAMGKAVAADGTMAMQCQNCHGPMSAVADPVRTGWLDEPSCGSCHTGTATRNSGQIRYTSVFDSGTHQRVPADPTFTTNANVPDAGFSLYRFSQGHGGLQCSACHGSTHAEYPSSHPNDNVQSTNLQGHVGMLSDCTTCHPSSPQTVTGGPHGMHAVGQDWVSRHGDAAGDGRSSQCTVCHGTDYRGTVLSRALGPRTLSTEHYGTKTFWRGFQVSCYACHNGPGSESASPNHAPVAQNKSASTTSGTPVRITLTATDQDRNALTYRIVDQSTHGTVGLVGNVATYYPEAGYAGADAFTYAAWDGSTNSNLATTKLSVTR